METRSVCCVSRRKAAPITIRQALLRPRRVLQSDEAEDDGRPHIETSKDIAKNVRGVITTVSGYWRHRTDRSPVHVDTNIDFSAMTPRVDVRPRRWPHPAPVRCER